MCKKKLLCCGLVALMLCGCSSDDTKSKETTKGNQSAVESTSKEEVSTKEEITTKENKEDAVSVEKFFKEALKEFETKYESANNLPSALMYKIAGKDIAYHVSNDGFDIIYEIGLGDKVKYSEENDGVVEYKDDNVDWKILSKYVGSNYDKYGLPSSSGCVEFYLTALSDKVDTNNQLGNITINSSVEEVYKIYGMPDEYTYDDNAKVCTLKYGDIWLGNTHCKMFFSINEDLKVNKITTGIILHKVDAIEKARKKATFKSAEIMEVTPLNIYPKCKEIAEMTINAEVFAGKFDVNKVKYEDLIAIFKDKSEYDSGASYENYYTETKSYLRKYTDKNNWVMSIVEEDFKTANISGITCNSSVDDVKALFGPYYLEHSGGVLNDDNRFICYGYDMEDGSSYEMTFVYSDETKKITQFSISVKEK